MKSRFAIAIVLAATLVVLSAQDTRQTFRAGTDVVMVDVNVRADARNVTGLTAADFVLTDNGVRQQIESVEATAVPIDVTLVADVSGNARRPWADHRPNPSAMVSRIERELGEVTKILRPTDRVRLLTIDKYVRQLFPLQAQPTPSLIRGVDFDGLPSLYDGLAAALLQPVEPARRHVVVARMKGIDAMSVLSASSVRAIAARSDALFHLVMMETDADNEQALTGFQCANMGLCWPVSRFWIPQVRHATIGGLSHQLLPDGDLLKAGAESTGGGWHQAELLSVPSLAGTFKETFENFRASYMLRYTPQGVARAGWHSIEVKVPKSKSYAVSARRGYGVEERPPEPAVSTPPANALLKTLPELVAAYERRAYQQAIASIRRAADPAKLLLEFEAAGNPWPGAPRREAAFALELVEPALFSSGRPGQEQAYRLLERFTGLVRPTFEPDLFEREWTYAVLTLLQGAIRPASTQTFIDRALRRFPDDPRFVLIGAINAEQSSMVGTRVSVLQAPGSLARPATLDAIRRQYEAAIALPATATEARIRLGWLLNRGGKPEEALSLLNTAGSTPIADPSLRYLQRLFLGHVLAATNKFDDAIVAFRGAASVIPEAQSARVALMNALMLQGDRAEAESLAEQIQSDKSESIDPWWMYWQGQYRMYPQAMSRLREMAK